MTVASSGGNLPYFRRDADNKSKAPIRSLARCFQQKTNTSTHAIETTMIATVIGGYLVKLPLEDVAVVAALCTYDESNRPSRRTKLTHYSSAGCNK